MCDQSQFVGKYVCFGLPDGSFTWGRIKAEGFVNTPEGEKSVFILTDRMTCRIIRNDLEMASFGAISHRISIGGDCRIMPNLDSVGLPDYQRAGYGSKMLQREYPTQASETSNTCLPMKSASNTPMVPEKVGSPELSGIMDIFKSSGLPMLQKTGAVVSSRTGETINYVLRRFGYDTNVRKDKLNLEGGGDIVDRRIEGMQDLTDDELFLISMRCKMEDMGINRGTRNMLMAGRGDTEEDVENGAIEALKIRKGVKPQ